MAKKLKAEYWEVSAKNGSNVKELFDRIALVVLENSVLDWLHEKDQNANTSRNTVSELVTRPRKSSFIKFNGSFPESQPQEKQELGSRACC